MQRTFEAFFLGALVSARAVPALEATRSTLDNPSAGWVAEVIHDIETAPR